MNYWITSDLHLGHEAVFEFEPDRKGFEKSIKQLNCVGPKDILINLGDIGFYNHEFWIPEYVKAVKGKKILTLGNHDKHSYNWFYDKGFDFICERFTIHIYGFNIIFSHKPVEVLYDKCINIFGHCHRLKEGSHLVDAYPFYNLKTHILITTENDCKPVNLKTIVDKHRHTWYNTDNKIKEQS